MSIKRTLLKTFSLICIAITPLAVNAGGVAASVPSLTTERFVLFTDSLRPMLPPVLSDFAERYLYERISKDPDASETARKMKFDEVVCSFPINRESISRLQAADGLGLDLDRGKTYRIRWFAGDDEIGSMKFPASYNLIRFTDQIKSHRELVEKLRQLSKEVADSTVSYIGVRPDTVVNPFKRTGPSFYLRHLEASTYLDSITGRPLWTPDYPTESLANLFVMEYPVADVTAIVEVVAYNGKTDTVRLPFRCLNALMRETDCSPYYGVSGVDDETGAMETLTVYHNPDLSYLHKFEMTVRPEDLWPESGTPEVRLRLTPYIKLHNLKNLWGDKK